MDISPDKTHPDTPHPDTLHDGLRGGYPPWRQRARAPGRPVLAANMRCDVLVVGAGITGSFMAEHLSALGHQVCVLDREQPGLGSTAASTAMLLWEIDASLGKLTQLYGFERAAEIYRHSLRAVSGLKKLVESAELPCGFRARNSLYLAEAGTDPRDLLAEHLLRERADLPGNYLDHRRLLSEFALTREAALLSPGSAEVDPVLLSQALLARAGRQGASLLAGEAVSYEVEGGGVLVGLANGCAVEACKVVLATGYVMPEWLHAPLHAISSTWAIATPPQQPGTLWRDRALIWEAGENYSYARTTTDNRIVIGGEDDSDLTDQAARDGAMAAKTKALLSKLAGLWPTAACRADFQWSGAFGETADGLPLIGAVPGQRHMFAAYGYGGNGITFSYMASRLIGRMIAGAHEDWFEHLAVDRPVPLGA
ncbi:MAG: FAD-dependent oxidoreductase [Reyranella sp.]|nr:FAD-dependent oxidoreductase [Reyranella sp.]MDP3162965.1 FAD-dependent oxidoreductase [Reyranella sp.]